MTAGTERSYRGLSAEGRRADRRRRLLDAALELFGTRGYAATRIKDLCAAAGVTERHFYEAWETREDLLLDLYGQLVGEHLEAVAAALAEAPIADAERHVRAGLRAALGTWAADARRARVVFVEVVGVSERVEAARYATLQRYAGFLAADMEALADAGTIARRDFRWPAHALLGAVTHCVDMWIRDPDPDQFAAMLAALADLFLAGVDAGT